MLHDLAYGFVSMRASIYQPCMRQQCRIHTHRDLLCSRTLLGGSGAYGLKLGRCLFRVSGMPVMIPGPWRRPTYIHATCTYLST